MKNSVQYCYVTHGVLESREPGFPQEMSVKPLLLFKFINQNNKIEFTAANEIVKL